MKNEFIFEIMGKYISFEAKDIVETGLLAKEGLLKQHTSEKAIQKLADALKNL